ncbi:hypothetical protein TSUD_148440 [Trifolium subterraneum]|uniref:Uncharacterized protein n=1 Tax=Trifolium subterraneum TaxID=3900 RepID=A0A2Z6MMB2_TRISU|nr:hypothetical protein TSUD_148440 [Trifolium subterraneum]
MWKLLDIGVERVRQCVGKSNLNSNEKATENKFMQNEKNECSEICNPRSAKTKGMSNVRKKGHFEKRKRSSTKAKKSKEKHNEGAEQNNVLDFTNDTSRVVYTTLDAPVQQHPFSSGLDVQSVSFSALLQGIDSYNYLSQETSNHSWLPPSSNSQDKY